MLFARKEGDLEEVPMLQVSVLVSLKSRMASMRLVDSIVQLTGLMRAKNGPGYFARG